MATFKFGRRINIHWNGYDIVGPADTVFSIPDQLYEEFNADISGVEPTLQWIDTNEFQTLKNSVPTGGYVAKVIGTSPVSISSTSNTSTISISSGTAGNGYLLVADGTGGTIWNPASTSGLTSVVGISPISSVVSGGTVSVSLNATYASSASGTSPISATLSTAGVLSVSIDATATSAENASRTRTKVRNSTASTITKGSVVYIVGSSGTVPTIEKALANADATSARTFGIVETDITSNTDGYVTNQGLLTGLDTSAAGIVDGAVLWLSPTIAGAYTTTKPAGPNHGVLVGIVVKGQTAGAGSIYVLIKNGAELDEIHDVNISGLANGDALIYSSTASVWQNQTLANAGIAASTHTHPYQAAGTYVNAVIGTSPASVSTASGTSTVSIVAGSINSTHLSASSVGASQIIDGSVGSAEIAAAAVNTSKISSAFGGVNAAAGTFLRADGAGAAAFASISQAVVSEFTASGTWVKPSGTTAVYVLAVGGGGGGTGGAHGASAANTVGPGGSGGAVTQRFLIGSAVNASVTVTIGQGGTTTAGSIISTPAAGANGTSTTFGTDVYAAGGTGGSGLGASRFVAVGRPLLLVGAFSTSSTINTYVMADGSGAMDAGSSGANQPTGADGLLSAGGGGGGNDGGAGTSGGIYIALSTSTNGVGGGASGGASSSTANGGNGSNGTRFGEGGGGGGSSSFAGSTGGKGGNGYLGGGGGGGGDGVSFSGAGGSGGNGYCLVISW